MSGNGVDRNGNSNTGGSGLLVIRLGCTETKSNGSRRTKLAMNV